VTARREGEHTWILDPVDPDEALATVAAELRDVGAHRAAERLEKRLRKNKRL
jgi:hypothetical protein